MYKKKYITQECAKLKVGNKIWRAEHLTHVLISVPITTTWPSLPFPSLPFHHLPLRWGVLKIPLPLPHPLPLATRRMVCRRPAGRGGAGRAGTASRGEAETRCQCSASAVWDAGADATTSGGSGKARKGREGQGRARRAGRGVAESVVLVLDRNSAQRQLGKPSSEHRASSIARHPPPPSVAVSRLVGLRFEASNRLIL